MVILLRFTPNLCTSQIKETKKSVRDSETGVQQIAVGHHIKDRAHIIKQLQNNKTGDREFNQEFLNMDECECHNDFIITIGFVP